METPGPELTGQVMPAPPEADEPETDAHGATPGPVWHFLVQPRWLGWHLFVIAAVCGMLWLGHWQYSRAIEGNGLSWAYTFEWPLFAVFGIVFWARTIRDEFRVKRGIDTVIEHGYATDLPDGIGAVQAGGLPGDDDDPELVSYNAHLAKLNARAEAKAKAITTGRKAITTGRKAITRD
jgi:DNA-binding transcriptional regulator of glucitol operon